MQGQLVQLSPDQVPDQDGLRNQRTLKAHRKVKEKVKLKEGCGTTRTCLDSS